MTGESKIFAAMLKGRREQLKRALAERKQALAELDGLTSEDERELREIEALLMAMTGYERDLAKVLDWPKDKPVKVDLAYNKKTNRIDRTPKDARRPTKWKGRHGYEFVSGVLTLRARDKCTVAAAIRKMKADNPAKWPEDQRDLERRFQEIKDDWEPWFLVGAGLEKQARALLSR
jgi:hypothetical protein